MATRIISSVICVLSCLLLLESTLGHIYGEKPFLPAGGREAVSTDDPQVIALSRWAAKRMGGICMSITRAEKQLVAGLAYFIRFNMKKAEKNFFCQVEVWIQPWRKWTKLVKHHCVRERTTSQIFLNL